VSVDHREEDEILLANLRTGDWLDSIEFPPLRYAIPELLPEGFTLLAGSPKVGKSWLVLDMLLSVAGAGKALSSIPVLEPRPVLYLSLIHI
jgi:RecA-family ATPase